MKKELIIGKHILRTAICLAVHNAMPEVSQARFLNHTMPEFHKHGPKSYLQAYIDFTNHGIEYVASNFDSYGK